MILTKTMKIKIVASNVNYWRDKGYIFESPASKWGIIPEIEVKVSELKEKSNVIVECRCEDCGIEYSNRISRNTTFCKSCILSQRMKDNINGKSNGKNNPNPGYEKLNELHNNQKLCARDICKHFNITRPVLNRWFQEINFPYKNTKAEKNIPSKEELIKLHCEQKINLEDLVKHYKTSFRILKLWFKTYQIEQNLYRIKRKIETI